jgi:DNA polymerase III subunit epsilon
MEGGILLCVQKGTQRMNHTLQLTRPLAVLDLETTGTAVLTDRIVEIAILKLLPNGESTSLRYRVNPEMPIPPSATAVHGITDADVALEPTFKRLAVRIRDYLKDCDLAGYNIRRFDMPLLRKEFERTGSPLPDEGMHVIDAQTIFHMREPRDLSAALRYYCDKEHTGAHGALADVEATAEVLIAQLERYDDLPKDIPTLESVVHPRDPSWVDDDGKIVWEGGQAVLSFGKHKGRDIRELIRAESGYIDWIIGGEFPESTKRVLREAQRGLYPSKP